MEQAHKHKDTMSYQSRLMAAMFVGQDLDGTLTSDAIQANQGTYGVKQEPSQAPADQAVKPTQGGVGKITLASRSATDSSALAARTRKL
jgi:hypothetical protein